jgi:hypothetical protein
VMIPFQCINNPNRSSSIATNPAVVCWESEVHRQMAILGVAGVLCYPVAFLSLVGHITRRRPALIASGRGLVLIRRFRWLFNRFRPECFEDVGAICWSPRVLFSAETVVILKASRWSAQRPEARGKVRRTSRVLDRTGTFLDT